MARTEEWRRPEAGTLLGDSPDVVAHREVPWGCAARRRLLVPPPTRGAAACGPSCMFGGPLADPPIESLGLAVAFGVALLLSARALGDWLYARAELAAGELARMAPALPRRASKSSPRTRNCREAPSSSPMAKRPSGHAPTGSPVGCEAPAWRCAKRPSALPRAESSRDSPSVRPGSRCGPWPTWSLRRPDRAARLLPAPMLWCAEWTAILAFGAWMNGRLLCWGRLPFRGGRRQVRDVGRRRFVPKGRAS